MSKLFVITFKRPALDIEKMLMHIDTAYDCEALSIPEVAEIKYRQALNKYEDVEMFECEDYEYIEFVKNEDAYVHFTRTGEHSMKPIESIEEDVDVGTDSHTETLQLMLEMVRPNESASFDYNVDIDDVGQIVFTPSDATVSFVDIERLAGYDSVTDIIDGNTRRFSMSLTANMISESENFDWFCDIDDIGQAVITPDAEETSFLTVSVNDSLNLVTECSEGQNLTEDSYKDALNNTTTVELCTSVIDDLEKALNIAIIKARKIETYFEQLGIHSADIEPYMVRYLESFINDSAGEVSAAEFRSRLVELETKEDKLEEEIDELDRHSIVDRFMKGNISVYSDEGTPDSTLVHLDELDSNNYHYYYDEESDSVVSYYEEEAV